MEEESRANMSSLLEVNQLDYRMPPSLSIATSRTMKAYRSQDTGAGAKMGVDSVDFRLSTGATYVDFHNSFLRFKVKFSDLGVTLPMYLTPHTGWAQSIKTFTITHSSGVELDRMNDSAGEWCQIQAYLNQGEQSRRTRGALSRLNDTPWPSDPYLTNAGYEQVIGVPGPTILAPTAYSPGVLPPSYDQDAWVENMTANDVEVIIPLTDVAGFFTPAMLAPSFLAAGLQIKLDFHTPETFFFSPTGITPTLQVLITDPEVHLETFTLTDSMVRKLAQISAAGGLEWYWDACFQQTSLAESTQHTIQISRATSRANYVVAKTRLVKDVTDAAKDSFASLPWYDPLDHESPKEIDKPVVGNMNNFQIQLGAQYIPSRGLRSRYEFLHAALKTFSQFRRMDEKGGLTPEQFFGWKYKGDLAGDSYSPALAVAALPLESSSTLSQTGAAISAQRTAVVNLGFEFESPAAGLRGAKRVDLFVNYSKLVTLFLDSCVVRS